MLKDYKTSSVCVVDFGIFVELALKLREWFGKVYYFYPWQATAFPKSNQELVGYGFQGIENVKWFWDIVDKVDLFVFPDVYLGDLQEYLVRMGKRVWGSRRGDELEIYRSKSKNLFKKLGLPVGPFEVVKGINDLRMYLKDHPNQYVKCDMNRGDFETFEAINYKLAEPRLDELEHTLGAKKKIIDFIVEEKLKYAVEIGYDGYCIDGEYPRKSLVGIEIKSTAYLGKVVEYDKLPKEITKFNDAISPTLKAYNYRNFVSTENRITEDKTPYMIDFCARCGSPPSEITFELYENLPDILWFGAEGKVVDPETKFSYAAELVMESTWAGKNWLSVQFPKDLRDNIKLRNLCIIERTPYIIPQYIETANIGSVIALGNNEDEVINRCKDIAKELKGHFVETIPGALDKAQEEFKKLNEFGVRV